MGTFAGASEQYGVPLSFIHPKDNDFAKARFHPLLLDPRLDLTNKQRRQLQLKIDDLAGLGRLAREKAIDKLIKNQGNPPKKTTGKKLLTKAQRSRLAKMPPKRRAQARKRMRDKL
jgi:hypothetical protein